MEISFKVKGIVETEFRFAVRKWFEGWVEAVNSGDLDLWQNALAESLTVIDLQALDLGKSEFIKYMTSAPVELLIPTVTISTEEEVCHLNGEWELLHNNMVVFSGLFEMLARQVEDGSFKIFGITFFPRLRLDVVS